MLQLLLSYLALFFEKKKKKKMQLKFVAVQEKWIEKEGNVEKRQSGLVLDCCFEIDLHAYFDSLLIVSLFSLIL